jgi:hypothetical protein
MGYRDATAACQPLASHDGFCDAMPAACPSSRRFPDRFRPEHHAFELNQLEIKMIRYVFAISISVMILSGRAESNQEHHKMRLSEDRIGAELQETVAALLAGDLDRFTRNISAEYIFVSITDAGVDRSTTMLNKCQYREALEKSLKNGSFTYLSLTNCTIEIAEDGKQGMAYFEFQQKYVRRDSGMINAAYGVQTNHYQLMEGVPLLIRSSRYARQVYLPAPPPADISTNETFRYRDELPDSFDGAIRSQIVERLPSDAYLLVDAKSTIPSDWPSEIRMVTELDEVGGNPSLSLIWWMTLNGDEWVMFYVYCLDSYRQTLKREPSMIYERRVVSEKTAAIPVMSIQFDENGVATNCWKAWCEVVRNIAFVRHAQQPIYPKDIKGVRLNP